MDDAKVRRSTLWIATLAVFFAFLNTSIVLISLPAVFRGLRLDPLEPGNLGYLLWLLTGYLVVTSVLVVLGGRLGDVFGRARLFTIGFGIFTVGALLAGLTPSHGGSGALELILFRCVQGVGGALLAANSVALVVDVYPTNRRGAAVGITQVSAIAGSFLGLLVGGLVADHSWRAVFLLNVPVGVIGTVWAHRVLRDKHEPKKVGLDPWGNVLFAIGLVGILTAMTYGIQPYGGHITGWTSPFVLTCLIGGIVVLGLFSVVEQRVTDPLVDFQLFRSRAFSMGNAAGFFGALARGGQQFMLVIWLQAIWLPRHGYSFHDTPLWAGVYLLPMSIGFMVAGPLSGTLSDRFGARGFASGGMLVCTATFVALMLLPANFPLVLFLVLLALNGAGFGMFSSPNATAVMNAVPASARGAASGIRSMAMNSGQVLSIGLFMTLLVLGLAGSLPQKLHDGLVGAGVPGSIAAHASAAPPVSSVFAAFLGYDPVQTVLGPQAVASLPTDVRARVEAHSFFPDAIGPAFMKGIVVVFTLAAVVCLISAAASWLRGGRFVADELDLEHVPFEEPDSPGLLGDVIDRPVEGGAVGARA